MKNAALLLLGGAGIAYIMFSRKTPMIKTIPQTTKAPQSASAPRADGGNSANQPWYSGPPVGPAQGTSVNDILSGIKSLGSVLDIFGPSSQGVPEYDFKIEASDTNYFEYAGSDNMSSDATDYVDPSIPDLGDPNTDNGELAYA